ncbi:hypothetical protein [Comamonas antarctica]|uniref:hypothetical protein n=1 Tax=Comamonas antarctica TaxID=2743470 RepID=UPI0028E9FDD6|nr:hypothetical protein [Comamonas antarctica]
MSSPIIAFLAGAGTGYLKQRNVEEDRKRDAEDQQWRNEQRDRQRKADADADALNTSLKQAQAPAEVVEGPLGDQSAGPPVPAGLGQAAGGPIAGQVGSSGAPAAAPGPSSTTPLAGQLGNQGTAPAASQVFRMVAPGGVNKTFNSAADAQAAAKEYSSPEAANARFVAAYRGSGHIDKALEVERNLMQGQAAKLQLDEATQARADKAWDQGLSTAASSADSLAQYFSGSPIVGGNQVKAIPAADGKTVQFVSLGADGKQTPLYQPVENNPASWAPLLTQMSRSLAPEARLQHMYRIDESRRQQANSDRDFKLKEQIRADDRDYKNRVLALRGTGTGSGGSKGNAAAPAAFDPLSDFDPKQARKGAMDQALDEAKNSASGQPVSEKQIAARAQAIYAGMRDAAAADNTSRQRELVFAKAARGAKTPEEIQAVRDRAVQSGFTEDEMSRIDARFTPAPAEKQAGPAPKTNRESGAMEVAPRDAEARRPAPQSPARPAPVFVAAQQPTPRERLQAAEERAAARKAQSAQDQQAAFIAAQEYEARKVAERRRIGAGMEELKRNAGARIQ